MPLGKILKDGSETGGTAADKINLAFDVADKNESDIKNVALKYKGLSDITNPAPAVLDIGDTYIASSNGTFDASWGMPPAETTSVGTWLMWNGAGWVYMSSGTVDVSSLTGIDLTNQALGDGDILTYNLTNQTFEVHTPTLADGSDVTITTPANDEVIMWNGTGWVNASMTLSAIDDMDLTNLGDGAMLIYNDTTKKFEVTSPVDTFTSAANVGNPVVTNNNGKVDSSLIDMNALVFKGTVDVTAVDTVTTPNIGDLYFNTTAGNWDASWGQGTGPAVENEAIVWDGSDWVHLGPMTSIQNLGGLADVAYGGALAEGDYLSYDATNSLWVKRSAPSVDALTDVDVTAKGDGKIVAWDQTSGKYVFVDNTHAFDDLTDVDVTAKGDGKLIVWDQASGKYVFTAKVNDFGDLSDITVTTPTNGQVLTYDFANSQWVNLDLPPTAQPATTIGAMTDTNLSGMTDGQVLTYDLANGEWVNQDIAIGTVIDSLTSTSTTDGLSANQGKALKDLIDAIVPITPTQAQAILDNASAIATKQDLITATNLLPATLISGLHDVIDNLTSTSTTDGLSANQGKILKDLLDAVTTKSDTNETDIVNLKKLGKYVGTFADTASRDATVTTPNTGDYCLVGTGPDFDEYIFDTVWEHVGSSGGVVGTTVVDSLTSNSATSALSANQGMALKALIDAIVGITPAQAQAITDNTTAVATKQDEITPTNLLPANLVDGLVESIDDLDNVALTTPANGQVLTYDLANGEWVNLDLPPTAQPATTLNALTDTNLTGITDGQIMVYDLANTEWVNQDVPTAPPIPSDIEDLDNVTLTTPANDDILRFDTVTGQWVNKVFPTITSTLAALTDTNITALADGQGLYLMRPLVNG